MMFKLNATLSDIRSIVSPLQSAASTRRRHLENCLCGLDPQPPTQSTIEELSVKVNDALALARSACQERPGLLTLLDSLEQQWQHLSSQLILLSVLLVSLEYREEEEIVEILIRYQNHIIGALSTGQEGNA